MSLAQLTPNAVYNACVNTNMQKDAVVQVIQTKEGNNFKIAISDGVFAMTGTCFAEANDMFKNGEVKDNSIITIKQSTCTNKKGKVSINITMCEVLQLSVAATLGTPKKWEPGLTPATPVQNVQSQPLPPKPAPPPPPKKVPTKSQTSIKTPIQKVDSLTNYIQNFSVIVRIIKKEFKEINKRATGEPLKILTIIMADNTGEIKGTLWGDEAAKWEPKLEQGKVYLVSGGKIQYAKKGFNPTNNQYEISFDRNSRFEPATADFDTSDLGKVNYKFKKLKELETIAINSTIDVCGVIVDVKPKANIHSKAGKELVLRKCSLVDDSNVKVELTFWGEDTNLIDEGEEPVVVIKDVRVGEFNGTKNLSVSGSSVVALNPTDIKEADAIRRWFGQGESLKDVKSAQGSIIHRQNPLIYASIIEKENLGLSERNDYFDIIGGIGGFSSKGYFYMSCSNPECRNKKVTEREDQSYFCDKCKQTIENPVPRYRFSIKINDFSGSFYADALGDDPYLAKLMGMNAKEFKEKYDEIPESENKQNEVMTKLLNPLCQDTYKFTIRASVNEYNGVQRPKMFITNVKDVNYGEAAQFLASEILKYE